MEIIKSPEREETYPARYYARLCADGHVKGWYDTWDMGRVDHLPPATDLHALTAEEWDTLARTMPHRKEGGKLVPHTPVAPLSQQASRALKAARQHVWEEYGSIGEPVPQPWIAYQKGLRAIRDGLDATSTALPARPTIS